MDKIKHLSHKIWLLLSFVAFLLLYVLQDARMDIIAKEGVSSVESYTYIITLVLLVGGWLGIFLTEIRKATCIQWKKLDIALLVFIFSILVTKCFYSKTCAITTIKAHCGVISMLLILVGTALLALPCMMYALMWVREITVNKWEYCIDRFLQGNKFFYTCIIFACVGLLLAIYFSFSLTLWFDEAASLGLIKQSFTDITLVTGEDVHPPLYYYITKIIAEGFLSFFPDMYIVYAARLASVLPNIILVALCCTWGRRLWGNYVAGLGALALSAMPHMLEYAVEIRMYSWGLLWVTCCWISSYSVFCHNRWRDWVLLVFFGLAAAYTHYWACVAAAVPYTLLGIWCMRNGRAHILRWAVAAIMTIIGYLPWLPIVFKQVTSHRSFWIAPLAWQNFLSQRLMYPCEEFVVFAALIGVVVAAVYRIRKDGDFLSKIALGGISIPYLVIMLGAAIAIIQPVLVERYLIPSFGALWLGCLLAVRTPRTRIWITSVIVIISLCNIFDFYYKQTNAKETSGFFFSHIERTNKQSYFVCSGKSIILYDMAVLLKQPIYSPTNPARDFFKNEWQLLTKIKNVRSLLDKDRCVYFLSGYRKDEEIDVEFAKQIAKDEGLALVDEGYFEIGKVNANRPKFRLYRIEIDIPTSELVARQLTSMRLDIKNIGGTNNAISIHTDEATITQPKWFTDEKGVGQILENNGYQQKLTVTVVQNGKLTFSFRGADRREKGNRFPLWIDYKSIKIDGKEILTAPIATWHDKPFRYEMPVKDGQEVVVEVEQTYHSYSRNELRDIILKLNPQNDYISTHLDEIIDEIHLNIEKQKNEVISEQIVRDIAMLRLNIKNIGTPENAVDIKSQGANVIQPKWFTNEQGIGRVLESTEPKQKITITAIKDGKLLLTFLGADKRQDGKRFPLWIDYKSIKIDGKEILTSPIATWHDKPYRYEMPVKDGQEVVVEVEQAYHPYSKEELEDIILKLNPKSEYITSHLKEIADEVHRIITQSENPENSESK